MRRKRTAVPRLRITTGYVPELPQQRRDTIALFPAACRCGPRSWALPEISCYPLQFAECAAIGGRTEQAQPAAGSRCSCGAGGHGARAAAAPLSECAPGLHGGRAAGDDRAETPGPQLRGGPSGWVGCRGCRCCSSRRCALLVSGRGGDLPRRCRSQSRPARCALVCCR